jgi:hypothetical protein
MSNRIRKSKFDIIHPSSQERNQKIIKEHASSSTGSLYSLNLETLPVGIMATIVKQELSNVNRF